MRNTYNAAEAARVAGVDRRTIVSHLNNGKLKGTKALKDWQITPQALKDWAKANRVTLSI